MCDEADIAQVTQEIMLKANLKNSARFTVSAVAIGECLFCGETVPEHVRWCDVECRNDWEKENER